MIKNYRGMIHKQFEYKRKLAWAAVFLIVFFSTASSVIKQKQTNESISNETAGNQTGSYEFLMINFLND
jgi:hypothetical protein